MIFVWLHHNVGDKKIGEMPVINTDESDLTRVRRFIGNFTRQTRYILTKNSKTNRQRQNDTFDYVTNNT